MIKVAHRTLDNLYCRCPFGRHKDENPSLRIALTGQYAGTFKCFGCGKTGYAHELGIQIDAKPTKKKKVVDFQAMFNQSKPSIIAGKQMNILAEEWRVTPNDLDLLGYSWDGKAHIFPMKNEYKQIIGLQQRFPNGRKICVKGSSLGLGIPSQFPGKADTLLITEGFSDLAVALDLGYAGICRMSCNTGSRLIDRWLRRHCQIYGNARGRIFVVSDNGNDDEREGAKKLQKFLLTKGWSVSIIKPEAKDLRSYRDLIGHEKTKQWLQDAVNLEVTK